MLLNLLIQLSSSMTAVTAVVVAYQGRTSSLPVPGSLQQGKPFSQMGALFRLFLRHILFCLQEELLSPFQQRFPLLLVSPTGKPFLQAFHHLVHDRKVIDHDVRLREAKLDCWAKRSTPIHTHGLHSIRIAEPFQQSRDVFEFASRTHFSHLTGFQIAYNRVRAMAVPRSKLVNSQKTRRMEGLIFLHRQSFALDFLGGNGFKAVVHHMMTHPTRFGHMRYGLDRGLFATHLSEAFRRPAFLSTNGIWLGKTFLARQASEAPFGEDQFDVLVSRSHIALLSRSCSMDLHTRFLAMRANCLGCGGDHLGSNGAIRLPFLLQNVPFRQTHGHENTCSSGGFLCGMLAWQGWFSLT